MIRFILIGLLIIPSLLACSKAENEPYSQALVNDYMSNCVAMGNPIQLLLLCY